ncbi:MAG TPA: hypothetical protein VMD29_16925 [Terracidiphilus sp.]|nr:hypothetical protein [Terracidiphilus sp.]
MSSSAPPTKIMIIRHGEKPPKKKGELPLDVQENGEPGNGKSLIVPGWQRAGALNAFFAPYKAKPADPHIHTPDFIYAASPNNESQRPWETVVPLAAWLDYTKEPQLNTSFSIGGGEGAMVQSVLGLSGHVLICWEHDNIMPNIMKAICDQVPISNYSKIPNPFPDVFYLVWILDLEQKKSGNEYKWSWVNQNLMAGDVKS